jgi:hypothetical protein
MDDLAILRKGFHDALSLGMHKLGYMEFKYEKYYARTAYGKIGVFAHSRRRFDALQIDAGMFVFFEEVEKLLFHCRASIRPETALPKPNNVSIAENLGNIKSGMYRLWNNYSLDDVRESVAEIENLVRSHGIPFVQRVDTPEKALNEMLLTFDKRSILRYHPSLLFEHTLVLMFYLRRKDLFDQYTRRFRSCFVNDAIMTAQLERLQSCIDRMFVDAEKL